MLMLSRSLIIGLVLLLDVIEKERRVDTS